MDHLEVAWILVFSDYKLIITLLFSQRSLCVQMGFSISRKILVPVTEINYRYYFFLGYLQPVTAIIISWQHLLIGIYYQYSPNWGNFPDLQVSGERGLRYWLDLVGHRRRVEPLVQLLYMALSMRLQLFGFRHISMGHCILRECVIAGLRVQLASMAVSILGVLVETTKVNWFGL